MRQRFALQVSAAGAGAAEEHPPTFNQITIAGVEPGAGSRRAVPPARGHGRDRKSRIDVDDCDSSPWLFCHSSAGGMWRTAFAPSHNGPYSAATFSTRIIAVCPAACGPRTRWGVMTITSVA